MAFKPGDKVRILAGGPHENMGRIATVGRVTSNGGNVVIYFGGQDEDEWLYGADELEKAYHE